MSLVQVGDVEGTLTTAFSYDAPVVTAVEPGELPTSGAPYLWLRGHNFGHLPDVELYCRCLALATVTCR